MYSIGGAKLTLDWN